MLEAKFDAFKDLIPYPIDNTNYRQLSDEETLKLGQIIKESRLAGWKPPPLVRLSRN